MTVSSGVEIHWTKMTSMKVLYIELRLFSSVVTCSSLAFDRQKLSGWNTALIIILFVVGVCVAIALAVLLTRRIIAGCKWHTLPLYYTLCALQLE